jgi:DNA-binding NtrC family response regulator
MDIINISLIIIAIINLAFATFIYLRGKQREVSVLYSINILTIIGWILGMIAYRAAPQSTSLFWCIVLYISPTPIASTFLYFTYIFPYHEETFSLLKKRLIFLGNAIIILLVLTPNFIIQDVIIRPGQEKAITFGPGYTIYAIYILGYFLYGFWKLLKKIFNSYGTQKYQIIYLLIGYSAGANISFITNLIMPWFGRFELNWVGQTLPTFMVCSVSYAIIRYRLMDINVVISRTMAYGFTIVTFSIIYIGIMSLIKFYVELNFWSQLLATLPFLFITGIVFQRVYLHYFQTPITDRLILRGKYDYQEVLKEVPVKIATCLKLEDVLKVLYDTFYNRIKVINPRIFLIEGFGSRRISDRLLIYDKETFLPVTKEEIKLNSPLIHYLLQTRQPLLKEDIHLISSMDKNILFDAFGRLSAALIIPCVLEYNIFGLLVLGEKLSKDIYTDEDIRLLKAIGTQTTTTLNYIHHQERAKEELQEKLEEEQRRRTERYQAESIPTSPKILIIDDDEAIISSIKEIFKDNKDYELIGATTGNEGLKIIKEDVPNLVLLDLKLPDIDGFEVLRQIKQINKFIEVIIISVLSDVEKVVYGIKSGATNYLDKPFNNDTLKEVVTSALKSQRIKITRFEDMDSFEMIIGASLAMQEVYKLILKVLDSKVNVLISGETGTGKELVARMIHYRSPWRDKPFIPVDCTAIPETLLESELFGIEERVATGVSKRSGKFEQAHEGTIFLDEISNMSLSAQAKLLRVIQERKFTRIGGKKEISVDVRIISATNKNLTEEIRYGRFREDLYYRLNVVNIHLPPLRERGKKDIKALSYEFFSQANYKYKKSVEGISNAALDKLCKYHWPGNVRELQNVIERAVIIADDLIYPEHISLPAETDREIKELRLKEIEKKHILYVLEQTNFNKTQAAKILGIDRTTLNRKLATFERLD